MLMANVLNAPIGFGTTRTLSCALKSAITVPQSMKRQALASNVTPVTVTQSMEFAVQLLSPQLNLNLDNVIATAKATMITEYVLNVTVDMS